MGGGKQSEAERSNRCRRGKIYRDISEGQHWTSIVEKRIKDDRVSIALIPDVRYVSSFPKDEVWWIKNKMDGILVYLKRSRILSPNDEEKSNAPKLAEAADYRIELPTVKNIANLSSYADNFIKFIEPRLRELS